MLQSRLQMRSIRCLGWQMIKIAYMLSYLYVTTYWMGASSTVQYKASWRLHRLLVHARYKLATRLQTPIYTVIQTVGNA